MTTTHTTPTPPESKNWCGPRPVLTCEVSFGVLNSGVRTRTVTLPRSNIQEDPVSTGTLWQVSSSYSGPLTFELTDLRENRSTRNVSRRGRKKNVCYSRKVCVRYRTTQSRGSEGCSFDEFVLRRSSTRAKYRHTVCWGSSSSGPSTGVHLSYTDEF